MNSIIVLAVAALMTTAAAAWTLRAYRMAGGGMVSARPALFTCGAVAVIALAAYLAIGRPELPDAPMDARLEALRHRDPTSYSPEEALAVLTRAARDNPRDARPHLFAGQILLSQDRAEEAARQFDAALRRDPRSTDAMMGMGRAMVRVANGRVTPEALALFQQVGVLTHEPAPWIYQTMAAMQNGRVDEGRRLCAEAVTRGAPAEMCGGLTGASGPAR